MEKEKLVNLSPNQWHGKLIVFTFGYDPTDFKSLCPYFWLMMASFFVCPFVAVYKSVKYILDKICDAIDKFMDGKIMYDYETNVVPKLTKGQIFYIFNNDSEFVNDNSNIFMDGPLFHAADLFIAKCLRLGKETAKDTIMRVMGYTDEQVSEWKDDYLSDLKMSRELREEINKKEIEKYRKSNEAKKRMKQRMYKIAHVTETLFKFALIVAVVLCVAALSNCLTYLLIRMFDIYVDWGYILRGIGGVIVSLLLAFSIIGVLTWVFYRIMNMVVKWYELKERNWYQEAVVRLVDSIIWIGNWLCVNLIYKFLGCTVIYGILNGVYVAFKEFGGIFADYLSSSYNDYCPGIEWKREED